MVYDPTQFWFEYKYGYEDNWTPDARHLIPHKVTYHINRHYRLWPLCTALCTAAPYMISGLADLLLTKQGIKELSSFGWYRSRTIENISKEMMKSKLKDILELELHSRFGREIKDLIINIIEYISINEMVGQNPLIKDISTCVSQIPIDMQFQIEYLYIGISRVMEFCVVIEENKKQNPLYKLLKKSVGGRDIIKQYKKDEYSIDFDLKNSFNELYNVTPLKYVEHLQSIQNSDDKNKIKSIVYEQLDLYVGGAARVLDSIVLDYLDMRFLVRCFIQQFM